MSDPLATYLHDHLAGAVHALDLVAAMSKRHEGEPLGQFAGRLRVEIEADREALRGLAERTRVGSSGLKEMTAWLGEKVSRAKLSDESGIGFGTFQSLEFLTLGIHGKRALWIALEAIAENEPRLQGLDFARLAVRAEEQEAEVEQWRLRVAGTAFGGAIAKASA